MILFAIFCSRKNSSPSPVCFDEIKSFHSMVVKFKHPETTRCEKNFNVLLKLFLESYTGIFIKRVYIDKTFSECATNKIIFGKYILKKFQMPLNQIGLYFQHKSRIVTNFEAMNLQSRQSVDSLQKCN